MKATAAYTVRMDGSRSVLLGKQGHGGTRRRRSGCPGRRRGLAQAEGTSSPAGQQAATSGRFAAAGTPGDAGKRSGDRRHVDRPGGIAEGRILADHHGRHAAEGPPGPRADSQRQRRAPARPAGPPPGVEPEGRPRRPTRSTAAQPPPPVPSLHHRSGHSLDTRQPCPGDAAAADDQHCRRPWRRAEPAARIAMRTQSDNLLRLSRRALAVGDVRRAVDLLNQAKRLQVRYGPLDDSPERAEAAISKYQEIMTLDRNTEARPPRLRPHVDGTGRGAAPLRRIRRGGRTGRPCRPATGHLWSLRGPSRRACWRRSAAARRQSERMIRPVSPPADDCAQSRASGQPGGTGDRQRSPACAAARLAAGNAVSSGRLQSGPGPTYNVQATERAAAPRPASRSAGRL